MNSTVILFFIKGDGKMRNFTDQDFEFLDNILSPKRVLKEGNQSKFVKVAFDIFRKFDDDGLWKIEADENGVEYFVRTSDEVVKEGSIDAVFDDDDNITILHNDVPVCSFSALELGLTKEEIPGFCTFLKKKSIDEDFIQNILKNS